MPKLRHPETGQLVRASTATAEKLAEDGWTLFDSRATDADTGEPDEAPKPTRRKKKDAEDADTGESDEAPSTPLNR